MKDTLHFYYFGESPTLSQFEDRHWTDITCDKGLDGIVKHLDTIFNGNTTPIEINAFPRNQSQNSNYYRKPEEKEIQEFESIMVDKGYVVLWHGL